jgi:Flp pilus assembly protein TadG
MKLPILHTRRTMPTLTEGLHQEATLPFGDLDRNLPSSEVKLERTCRTCRRNRQGAAVVEFAIVAPVFFLLVFGMIEFGRAIMVQQILTNASREGARRAVLDGSTAADVNTFLVGTPNGYLPKAGIANAVVTITPTEPATAAYGTPVTVTVKVAFSNVTWLPAPWFISGSSNLTASTIMRRETVQ